MESVTSISIKVEIDRICVYIFIYLKNLFIKQVVYIFRALSEVDAFPFRRSNFPAGLSAAYRQQQQPPSKEKSVYRLVYQALKKCLVYCYTSHLVALASK